MHIKTPFSDLGKNVLREALYDTRAYRSFGKLNVVVPSLVRMADYIFYDYVQLKAIISTRVLRAICNTVFGQLLGIPSWVNSYIVDAGDSFSDNRLL